MMHKLKAMDKDAIIISKNSLFEVEVENCQKEAYDRVRYRCDAVPFLSPLRKKLFVN